MLGLMRLPYVLLLTASLVQAAPEQGDPRAVVRQALRAVEAGTASQLSSRWSADAARGSRIARLGLATIYRLTYRYAAADSQYHRIELTAGAHPDRIDAYARLDHGLSLSTRGELDAARREFDAARDAARAIGDRSAEAEALVALAAWRRHSAGAAIGLATIDSAASVAGVSDAELSGRMLCLRADLLATLARPDADSQATAALQLATAAQDPRTVAACLRAREIVVQTSAPQGDAPGPLDSAIVLLQHIADLQQHVHDRSGFALTLIRIAALQIGDSHLGTARSSLHQSLIEAEASGDRASQATGDYLLGLVSMRLGDARSAGEYLHGAIATFDALGDRNGAMVVRSNLPDLATLTGDTAAAMRDARIALPYFQRHGDVNIVVAMRRSIAATERIAHQWRAAQAQLDTARAEATSHGLTELARELVSDYGRLALDRGDLAAAERLWTHSLAVFTQSQQLDRYEALVRLADIHARTGQLDRAEKELILANQRLDQWRATLSDRELQLFAFQATSDGVSDPGNSVANVIAALAAHGRVSAALTLADQRRARTVTDALLRTSAGGTAQAALGGPATTGLDRAIQSALRDSTTAVMEYSAAARSTPVTLFVVTRHDARAYVLSSADSTAPLTQRLTVLMEAGMDATSPARHLARLLLDRAIADLPPGVTRLVIITDGTLQRVPFDVLRLPDGRMVLQRFATSRVPSATVLLTLWRRPVVDRTTRLLAFGDPIFPRAPTSADTSPARDDRQAAFSDTILPPLPGSRGEVNSISRFSPYADVRLRADASATFLEHASLQDYSIIHFATHAIVDEHDNASTALVLSPGAGESGFVSPAELASLHLDADMVVLSACRSARGVLIGGEGVQGLTTPLLEAGARSVVASRWKVDDRRTATFVVDFYTQLAHGLPVSDALRAAKLAAIERGATPGEWAAFTVVGDPLVRLRLEMPSNTSPSPTSTGLLLGIIAFAGILGLAALAAHRYRTSRNRESRDRSTLPPSDVETHHE